MGKRGSVGVRRKRRRRLSQNRAVMKAGVRVGIVVVVVVLALAGPIR